MSLFSSSLVSYFFVQACYVFGVVFALLILFEGVFPWVLGIKNKVRENFHDFLHFQLGRSLFSFVCAVFIVTSFILSGVKMGMLDITRFSLFSQVVILLFCSELTIYGAHMAAHRYRIPLLTKAHKFHHTVTTDMDWTNSRKEHLGVLVLFMLVYCFYFFVIFRSSSASHVITTSLYLFFNALSHYRVHFSLRLLDQVFLFPQDHYRHHTVRGGPYGVALSLFDTLFGTRG